MKRTSPTKLLGSPTRTLGSPKKTPTKTITSPTRTFKKSLSSPPLAKFGGRPRLMLKKPAPKNFITAVHESKKVDLHVNDERPANRGNAAGRRYGTCTKRALPKYLGGGAFGGVFQVDMIAQHKSPGQAERSASVAVKRQTSNTNATNGKWVDELMVLLKATSTRVDVDGHQALGIDGPLARARSVGSQDILPILDAKCDQEKGELYITQPLGDTTLRGRMLAPVPARAGFRWAYQMMRGLAFLHRHGIIHKDVKPENIVIVGPADDGHLQLIDLGAAQLQNRQHAGECVIVQDGDDGPAAPKDYTAPEVTDPAREHRSQTVAIDVCSAGKCLRELLDKVGDDLAADEELAYQSLELARLLDEMVLDDPAERPTAAAAGNRIHAMCDALYVDFDEPLIPEYPTPELPRPYAEEEHQTRLQALLASIQDLPYQEILSSFEADRNATTKTTLIRKDSSSSSSSQPRAILDELDGEWTILDAPGQGVRRASSEPTATSLKKDLQLQQLLAELRLGGEDHWRYR